LRSFHRLDPFEPGDDGTCFFHQIEARCERAVVLCRICTERFADENRKSC
jgi:hypothetical protein